MNILVDMWYTGIQINMERCQMDIDECKKKCYNDKNKYSMRLLEKTESGENSGESRMSGAECAR